MCDTLRLIVCTMLWVPILTFNYQPDIKACANTQCFIQPSYPDDCIFLCTNGNIRNVFPCVGALSVVKKCPIIRSLIISSKIQYPNHTIPAHFVRSGKIQPANVKMDLDDIKSIENFAFSGGAFARVDELTLTNLRVSTLGPNTFYGLDTLCYLTLENVHLSHLPDCLAGVSQSLLAIHLLGSTATNTGFGLNNFTSGVKIPHLMSLRIQLNLNQSLTKHVFKNTPNIEILLLSSCRIEYIDRDAFYPIRKSVGYIDLTGNLMKTLPIGLFDYLLPQSDLRIHLKHNPWHCSCHLSELQKLLRINNDNFDDTVVCSFPPELENQSIANTTFCGPLDDEHMLVEKPVNFKTLKCALRTSNWIFTRLVLRLRELKYFVIQNQENGYTTFYILDADTVDDRRVVAFSLNASKLLFVNYRCGVEKRPIQLDRHFKENVIYTLCVQDTSTRKNIPQHCMSYFHKKPAIVFLWKRDRFASYLAVFGIAFALFVVGCTMAYVTLLFLGRKCMIRGRTTTKR